MGFDALGGIDKQNGAFTRLERTGDFVRKVHVAGRVDHLHDDLLACRCPRLRHPRQAHVLRLNSNAAFALDIHVIEELVTHIALRNHLG